jgi:hypothetical protein
MQRLVDEWASAAPDRSRTSRPSAKRYAASREQSGGRAFAGLRRKYLGKGQALGAKREQSHHTRWTLRSLQRSGGRQLSSSARRGSRRNQEATSRARTTGGWASLSARFSSGRPVLVSPFLARAGPALSSSKRRSCRLPIRAANFFTAPMSSPLPEFLANSMIPIDPRGRGASRDKRKIQPSQGVPVEGTQGCFQAEIHTAIETHRTSNETKSPSASPPARKFTETDRLLHSHENVSAPMSGSDL